MMSSEERIDSLHKRMAARRQLRERRTLGCLYASCSILAISLVLILFGSGAHAGGTAGIYTGAAILFGGAGPYVLTAIIAFMLGVFITVLLNRKQEKQGMEVKDR